MGDDDAHRQAVLDLASIVLAQEAPEELVVLDQTSAEFFDDPDGVLSPSTNDASVGFGVELALLTPVVLAITKPVVDYLVKLAGETLRDAVGPRVEQWVHRVLKTPDEPAAQPGDAPPAALSVDQAREVRRIAYDRARMLGLKDDRAALLADAVVGGVVVA